VAGGAVGSAARAACNFGGGCCKPTPSGADDTGTDSVEAAAEQVSAAVQAAAGISTFALQCGQAPAKSTIEEKMPDDCAQGGLSNAAQAPEKSTIENRPDACAEAGLSEAAPCSADVCTV